MTIPPCSRLCVVISRGSIASLTPHGAGAGGVEEDQCSPEVGGSVL